MKVIIAGGREVTGYGAECLVKIAIALSGWEKEITAVIHGGARGIDSAAQRVCERIWPVTAVPADWKSNGKAAGPIRNRKMACMADALIAVWDGESRGTKNMIETAESLKLQVYIYRYA